LHQPSHYRPDIDGLRAVAVLSVVLYHIDERFVSGGFTGVDIFFVISGYLITLILKREIDAGCFSIHEFYLRRIRRIAPAYFAVTLTTIAAGIVLLTKPDLQALARSALWSAVAMPNIYFWQSLDTGYFADASNQIPLLHLWSLGVEEQFYLIWPSLMLLATRWTGSRWTVFLLAILTAWSFHYAQQKTATDPSFAYYMLPARAGELGLGALLALIPGPTLRRDGGIGYEALALVGYSLLVAGLFTLNGESSFPGWNALFPCAGTALLIAAGSRRNCMVMAPLRLRPVVWIGLISYSLYLWHWPVLAFTRYFRPALDPALVACASIAMLTLAIASYYLVERPLRNPAIRPAWQPILLYAFPVGIVATMGWAAMHYAGRLPFEERNRIAQQDAAQQRLEAFTAPAFSYKYNCQLSNFDPTILDNPDCVHGKKNAPMKAILWGDSHAAHYIGVVASIAKEHGFEVRNASVSTCPPILGFRHEYGGAKYREACTRFRKMMASRISEYDLIFLGAQWSAGFRQYDSLERDLRATLRTLSRSGKIVVLLGQVPQFPLYDRKCESKNLKRHMVDCRARAEYRSHGIGKQNRKLRKLAERYPNVHYLDVHRIICNDGLCSPYLDGRPVYFDQTHMSMAGSWQVGKHLHEHAYYPRMFDSIEKHFRVQAGSPARQETTHTIP
jgi:peptidoglycan/LPS O-acetylase OafA/YrhL